jgi:hypothetical protein
MTLPLASPAGAQQAGRATPTPPPQVVLPPPIPLAQSRPGGDAGQCRATCARTYYFCKAGTEDDSCSGQFAQCNARCTATYRRPGA